VDRWNERPITLLRQPWQSDSNKPKLTQYHALPFSANMRDFGHGKAVLNKSGHSVWGVAYPQLS